MARYAAFSAAAGCETRYSAVARLDSADSSRSHFDLRELNYLWLGDAGELSVGIGKVFWGVAEFVHLVDIINQTDLVENIDEEELTRLADSLAARFAAGLPPISDEEIRESLAETVATIIDAGYHRLRDLEEIAAAEVAALTKLHGIRDSAGHALADAGLGLQSGNADLVAGAMLRLSLTDVPRSLRRVRRI